MSSIKQDQIEAGQAIYTPLLLKIYDLYVLGLSNRWIWRCKTSKQLKQYHQHATNNHCDIGVGTGYYLKHTQWQKDTQLSLLDLNPNSLAVASRKVASFNPQCIQSDIYQQQSGLIKKFDSISANYLLHCLPGNMSDKQAVIRNIHSMLKDGGCFFGATILSDENAQTSISRKLMALYNSKGIFSNTHDNYGALEKTLKAIFPTVNIEMIGCVALFYCKK